MEPRLNQFSEKELIFLGLMAEEKVKDFQYKIESCLKLPDGAVKDDLLKFYCEQLEIAELWNAQSLQASVQVKARNLLLNDN